MGFFQKLFGNGNKDELKVLLDRGALLIDVRSREEFNAGHAPKAINIPLQMLVQSTDRLKGKNVITVCKSGARSAMAVTMLQKEGVKAFNGGAWDNWQ
ncbi:rhodanese-like domain-containing protein [Panacibacter ginsenosidivorans]|uniref:Rhodanese-like domain-containing protein n=1 Tax=Panacibacter ginsenosidivorans TaxID=1813871 RepID=A0A5B8VBL2_9BACT|nr:rhodanese-like domain-containing protein [Panacibacter ginsenosidivorans]QEC68393.1 rhodanese-like domain-containing protein [Panacibacter ginsenosidivorans]